MLLLMFLCAEHRPAATAAAAAAAAAAAVLLYVYTTAVVLPTSGLSLPVVHSSSSCKLQTSIYLSIYLSAADVLFVSAGSFFL